MAQQTCKQLQSAVANANGSSDGGFNLNNLTPGGLIDSIGNAFGSHNKSQTFNTNINNTSISTTDITNIFNSCSNKSSLTQTNSITQSPECILNAGKICNGNLNCIKNITTISDITQENSKSINQNCILNNLIKTIASKNVSMENTAQILAAQKASGLMTSNSNITSNCDEVNNNLTSHSFLSSITHCANETSSEQLNVLNTCGNTNISQKNTSNLLNNCYIKQGIYKEDKIGIKSFNKANISTTQKSDSSMSSASSFIIIIIFVVLGVFVFIMYKKKQNQQMNNYR
jgi:hypothetical protein